jgi:D-beta-D-heptose 7-phosphate kinase/D-beta-D-heptose 1-phosphate adenosyltransferase
MVVGDLMLDVFIYGNVDRISPESPVPVLSIQKEDKMLGGAGNVLTNLCALGAKPIVFALVGDDAQADTVIALAKQQGADVAHILKDASRPTTIKTRFLARHQHMLRTDVEKTHPLSAAFEKQMLAAIEKSIRSVKAVVLSDYGKGVLTKTLLQGVIAAAKDAKVPVLVDPKGNDYSIYKGADYVTPNRKELAEATGLSNLKTDTDIESAAQKILAQSGIGCVIATRSEDGMSIIGKGNPTHIKTQAREVFDVSGAGDTVIATLAAALGAEADIHNAATLANIAAGIAVSKVGTTPVRADEIAKAIEGSAGSARQAPLVDVDAAREQVRTWQAQGLKVGFTNGCFDIVHKGHVSYLDKARSRCDRLILALNHDASVRILKGPTRPINDEIARATVMGALSSVDLVVFFGAAKAGEDNTPSALIDTLRPDIFFKAADYTIDKLPEAKIVQAYGGEVEIMGFEDGFSTTNIIAKSAAKG